MAILSDGAIRARMSPDYESERRIAIDPFDWSNEERSIQPCTIDVHLDDGVDAAILAYDGPIIDPLMPNVHGKWYVVAPMPNVRGKPKRWMLERGRLYIAVLKERVYVPRDLSCKLLGVSTNARCGLVIHQQAGHLDPRYRGRPTLEITALGAESTILTAGMRIGQLEFSELDTSAKRGYHGRYQGDLAAQPAKLPKDEGRNR